jgi:tRNA-splicing ligase RtcB
MKHQFETISEFAQKMLRQDEPGSGIFFVPQSALPNEKILESIQSLTKDSSIDQPVAVLSEAHKKPLIKSPAGTIIASSSNILPEVMDAAPNCGMRLIKTDLTDDELTAEKIDALFEEIKKTIPTGGLYGDIISKKLVGEILCHGTSAVKKEFDLRTKNEIQNTYEQGDFFAPTEHQLMKNPLQALSPIIIWIAKFRLNLLGATNSHFLQLAKISEITNLEKAQELGLKQGQYVFFMHTGSSIVGRYAASLYTPRKIKSLLQRSIVSFLKYTSPKQIRKILPPLVKNEQTGAPLFAYDGQSHAGKMFFSALAAVSNYGFANRALITRSLDLTMEKFFKRQIDLDLLYDAPHVFLSREKQAGKTLWIHRNGANRAFGPTMMASHPIFKKTGEPILIAPFEGTAGYIGVGNDENSSTYYSANHEIGKLKDLSISPAQYKNHAEKIISEMEKNKIMTLVAKVEPLKVLTYTK